MYHFGVLKVMVLFGIHPHAQNYPVGNFPKNENLRAHVSDASGTVPRCIGNGLPMHRERPRCYKPRAAGGKMYDFGVLKVMVLFGIHPHAQNTPKGAGDEFPMHREISRCIGNRLPMHRERFPDASGAGAVLQTARSGGKNV